MESRGGNGHIIRRQAHWVVAEKLRGIYPQNIWLH